MADEHQAVPHGDELNIALRIASESYRIHPGDHERAARAISAALGWSLPRARWCIEVNRDRLQTP